MKEPVAEDQGCEDLSVFDPSPWAREHQQGEACAAFRSASVGGSTTGALARVTVTACCVAIFAQKIPRSGENAWV